MYTEEKKKEKRGFLASAWPLRILRGVHDIGRGVDSKRRAPTVDRTPVERRLNEMNLEVACTVVPPSLFSFTTSLTNPAFATSPRLFFFHQSYTHRLYYHRTLYSIAPTVIHAACF